MGSKYPLSSMLRAGKYYKRGLMTRNQYMHCVVRALAATIKRGFIDIPDFKDQLDAIDLQLVEEDALELYELLQR